MIDGKLLIKATAEELMADVAGNLVDLLRVVRDTGQHINIALTGGSTGNGVLKAVAEHPQLNEVDWSRVHFWWSDERFVASDSDERNAGQARADLLNGIPIADTHVHEIAASDQALDLNDAVAKYATELAQFGSDERPWPEFDVCLLGVGPDGHVASLFPGRTEMARTDEPVLAVRDSPKPPAERATLAMPVIASSKQIWLVTTGSEKALAVRDALAGDQTPAAYLVGLPNSFLFIDQAAATAPGPA